MLLFSFVFLSIPFSYALAKDEPLKLNIVPSISQTTFSSSEWVGFKATAPPGKTYGNVNWTSYNGSDSLNENGGQTRYPHGKHMIKATVCETSKPKSCISGNYSFTTTNSIPDTPVIYMTPSEQLHRYTKVYFAHDVTKDMDGDAISFDWKVDNAEWINHAPNGIFTSGDHTISVRAKDSLNTYSNIGTQKLSILNAPPTKPVILTSPRKHIKTSNEVTFDAFSSDFDRDKFTLEWKLDDGDWTKTKPNTVLPRGQHIIFSKATDVKGNHSQIGYTVFDVENTAPSVPKITFESDKGPTAIISVTMNASGSVDVDGDTISYQIKVDNGTWQTSPYVDKFPRGEHTVYARAIDALKAISEVSSKIMKIENTKPTKPTVEGILGSLGISSEDVTFIASGSTDLDADPLSYQWKVDSGEWTNVAPNGKFKKGEHIVFVRAVDDYNGISDEATYIFTSKNSAPTTPTIVIKPSVNLTAASLAEFSVQGSIDYDEDILSYEWSYDGGSWLSSPPSGSLLLGVHTLSVRAKDTEGAMSPVYTTSFTVKKAPPSEPVISLTPSESLNPQTQISFSTISISPDNSILTYYWRVDHGPWTMTSPNGTFAEGSHTVSVQSQDSDGIKSNIVSKLFNVVRGFTDVALKESFEGTPGSFTFNGTWLSTNLSSNVGIFSYTSGTTADAGQNSTNVQFTIPKDSDKASLSFDFLVRSEENKDFFTYSIDGIDKTFSGFGTWTHVNIPLEVGTHTVAFKYSKDAVGSLYDDAAFIDDFTVNYHQYNN